MVRTHSLSLSSLLLDETGGSRKTSSTSMYHLLDTETASLNGGVCQIAWLVIDDDLDIHDQFMSLVNPEREIEEAAFAIHGISNEAVVNAPTLAEVCSKLPDNFVLFAYNAPFDRRMIAPAITPSASFCILKLARELIKGTSNHKLEVLQKELNLPPQKSHDALGDVLTAIDVLGHCLSLTDVPLKALIERQAAPQLLSRMPFGKHKGVPMLQVPKPYRQWLLQQTDLSADLRYTLEKLNKI